MIGADTGCDQHGGRFLLPSFDRRSQYRASRRVIGILAATSRLVAQALMRLVVPSRQTRIVLLLVRRARRTGVAQHHLISSRWRDQRGALGAPKQGCRFASRSCSRRQCLGASRWRVMLRHLLPNSLAPLSSPRRWVPAPPSAPNHAELSAVWN